MQLNSYFQSALEGTLEYRKEYIFNKKNFKRIFRKQSLLEDTRRYLKAISPINSFSLKIIPCWVTDYVIKSEFKERPVVTNLGLSLLNQTELKMPLTNASKVQYMISFYWARVAVLVKSLSNCCSELNYTYPWDKILITE